MENKEKFDSILIGSAVFAILFIGLGIWEFVTKRHGYLVTLGIGIFSLVAMA
ncbi:hypothetical protein JMF89_01000 [Clostridiaceae bacterium UIB06]|uniref:Uncharacterized protein n=1 Tax=Clostridium thailandense TaxID=2794346 RepID=A0A949TXC6_9CLOT|nr:hypothetical protein [Clostridium thailandense]MBV7275276.1 hypothetical protein [Clostridium thailandense]MCH5135792.1 hypothetical protein [Clostridiaceae bacterium UIB06]